MYDEERPKVLSEMARIVNDVERRPNHPWHKLLGDLTCDAFSPEMAAEAVAGAQSAAGR
jgi:hypothetical protein